MEGWSGQGTETQASAWVSVEGTYSIVVVVLGLFELGNEIHGAKSRTRTIDWEILAEVMDLAHSVNRCGQAFHSGLDLQR